MKNAADGGLGCDVRHRRAHEGFHTKIGWLGSDHSFSFTDHHDR